MLQNYSVYRSQKLIFAALKIVAIPGDFLFLFQCKSPDWFINGDLSEWLKEHAWKVCIPLKGIEGSNPSVSAADFMNDSSKSISSVEDAGGTAAYYDQFFGPLYFEPFAIEVVKRIDPESVSTALEIASGTGRVTRHIRECIPTSAKLIASDISEDMLGEAKKKLNHLDIEWQIIDAQELPFGDNRIDLVVCCFGYMFVPNKTKAFAEAYRVLKPGGMFLFTTWDKLEQNAASFIARTIAMEYWEGPLPESYNQATSMSDETAIEQLLQDAGFSKMKIEKVKLLSTSPSAKAIANGLIEGGGVYSEIKKRNPACIPEIKIKVEKELAEKFGAAPMISPISAVISQVWK
jgi:ubiquinone/menaquinone biosynthesis C-methylase UbiE